MPRGIRAEVLERAIDEKPWVEKQRLQPIGRLGEPREIGAALVAARRGG